MVVIVDSVACSQGAVSGPSRWQGKVASTGVFGYWNFLDDRCHTLAIC